MRPQDVIRTLEKRGFVLNRQHGSHAVLTRPGLRRPVIVSVRVREMPPRHIAKILSQAGLSVDEFLTNV